MKETLLCKFNVAVQVANFISYVKYIDKRENKSVDDLTNTLFNLVQANPNVEKDEIRRLIDLHSNALMPNMLKEEKFNYYYNTVTDYSISQSEISNEPDAPFVIKMLADVSKRTERDDMANYFTDLYKDELFILDVRYYGLEKKYIHIDFELYLSKSELVLRSSNQVYVEYLLNQYSMKDITSTLGLSIKLDYKGNYLTPINTVETITDAYSFDKGVILEFLLDSYEMSDFVFINHWFLKSVDLEVKDLIIERQDPKLIVILEQSQNQYFNYNFNNTIDRIEKHGNNTVLFVSENLFREACGNSTHLVLMNQTHNLSLNKLNSKYDEFTFLTKIQSNNRYMRLILDTYLERYESDSNIKNQLLYSFILESEELSRSLNYQLSNALRVTNTGIFNLKNRNRDMMPFKDLKNLLDISVLCTKIGKTINLTYDNTQLLLNEIESMIDKLRDVDMINDYQTTFELILKQYPDHIEAFAKQVEEIFNLLDIKRAVLTNELPVRFILDTSALIDEPDLFQKYFSEKNLVVHSMIRDELETHRGTNLNAIRAIRNINLFTNDPKIKLELIYDHDMVDNTNDYIKPAKIVKLENLMGHLTKEGHRPILVSSDIDMDDLYEHNRKDMIKLKHIPLVLN